MKNKHKNHSRKDKSRNRYEGTAWIIIMAVLLCILLPLCLLDEAGIVEVPDWIMILWLVAAVFVINQSAGALSWLYDYIHIQNRNKRDG